MARRDRTAPLPPEDDPVARSLDEAPYDDEPLTEDEIRAIEEAKRDPVSYSDDEARRMLGLQGE